MTKLSIQTKIGLALLVVQLAIPALAFIFGMPLIIDTFAPQFKGALDAIGFFTLWPFFAGFVCLLPVYLWVKSVIREEKNSQ